MKLWRMRQVSITPVILSITVIVWAMLLFPGTTTMKHCAVSTSGISSASLKMLLQMNPLSSQLTGWGLMAVSMMLPKLITPVEQIYKQSFRHYRFILSVLFALAYFTIWMLAGLPSIAIIIGLNLLMPLSYIPALLMFVIAVIWQFSPVKQLCLNRGHDHRMLSAFGWPAHRDAIKYGIAHGCWCVGSGWALMLFPMLLPGGHNLAMLLVTLVMLSEHMEHPQLPRWNFIGRGRLFRIIVAQAEIKWKLLKGSPTQ